MVDKGNEEVLYSVDMLVGLRVVVRDEIQQNDPQKNG